MNSPPITDEHNQQQQLHSNANVMSSDSACRIARSLQSVGNAGHLDEGTLTELISTATAIFASEPMLLEIEQPLNILGDIHGQFADLCRWFRVETEQPDACSRYLFLGDYVDRGKKGLEVMLLLCALKVAFPHRFFLLRGNHEFLTVNRLYGFYEECKVRYSVKLWKLFQIMFSYMPLAALINQQTLAMHGGLSPHLTSLDQLRGIKRPLNGDEEDCLATDLVWSDPSGEPDGWQENEERNASYTFGTDIMDQMCPKLALKMIIRAHEPMDKGYEFLDTEKGIRLITLFSAPAYGGRRNCGAMMVLKQDLSYYFHVLKPSPQRAIGPSLKPDKSKQKEKAGKRKCC